MGKPTPLDEQIVISVPAIVSRELFELAGRKMEENRKRKRNAKMARNICSRAYWCAADVVPHSAASGFTVDTRTIDVLGRARRQIGERVTLR